MIKLIIFDLGGVITSRDIEKLDNRIAEYLGIDIGKLQGITAKYKTQLCCGKRTLLELYSEVVNVLGEKKFTPKNVLDKHIEIYREIVKEQNKKLVSLVRTLRKKYSVVALTNAEVEIVEHAKSLGLYDHFEKVYVSTEMGLCKPDPQAFKTILEEFNIKPQETVFIDDKVEYVRAAAKLGIHAIHYKTPNQLKSELSSLRVTVN